MELAYRFALDRLFRERGNVQVRKPQNLGIRNSLQRSSS
jgi:hypothetical protein